MTHTHPHLAYRADIDGLRAIAVLAVVVFHAFPAALPGGFVGVDIFFVISGYLISSILYKALAGDGFSFAEFYARRVRRIFPALVLVVLTTLLAGWTVLFPDEYAQLGKHAAAGLGFVANIVLWQEVGYFDNAAELKPFLHLWSLGIEEQFYILWPIVALLAWRLRVGLGRVIVGLAVLSLLACIVLTLSDRVSSYFLPLTRAWELLAGALLAWWAQRGGALPPGRAADALAALGVVLILGALVLVDEHKAFPGAWALLPVGGAVALIAAGPRTTINRHLLAHPWMVGIGLISFPLYLWHWPLLSYVRIIVPEPDFALLGGAVLVAFVLSWLTWRIVETPVRRYGGAWTVVGLVITACIVGGLGANVYFRDGMSFRLKDAQAAAEAGALEWGDELRGEACQPPFPEGLTGRCLIADSTRAPDMMLIGDSHANHFYWGLSKEVSALGGNLLQVAEWGCPLLEGMALKEEGGPLICIETATAALDHAVNTPSIHTVFLAGRWVAAITGQQLRVRRGPRDMKLMPVLVNAEPGQTLSRGEIIIRALDATLTRLEAAGKRVVLIDSVPELDFNARECITSVPNRFVTRTPRPECQVSRAVLEVRNQSYRPLLNALMARHPQVAVVDPMSLMCDAQVCYGRRDGILLYRDDDHLSIGGSYWLGEQMRPILAQLQAPTH